MDLNQTLWNSKSNGHTKLIFLLSCLVLLIPSLILIFVGSSSENETLTAIAVIITGVVIVAAVAILVVGKFTGLRWDVSNLLFAVAESGFYFTGTVNQDSYFFAKWSEISGYSVKPLKSGLSTVTVYFNVTADAGMFGKIKSLKMVKIADFPTLRSVFEKYSVRELAAR